ncbi:MAG TPA: DUF932 domain-containing protein [Ohtaekwangia sp.]|nr:DUF932 domain-containing protein [Ohtaekwangia sp.]
MKTNMQNERVFLTKELQQDNVFVKSKLAELSSLTGMPSRRGLERALVSENQIVNVVSDSYGHLPNEKFFYEVEARLISEGIGYQTRSINRENRSFAVDYILCDESLHIKIKNGMDKLRPMLRFINSYDGSCRTAGYFGFFRELCSNGLHVAHSNIGFSVKHKGDIVEVVVPEIRLMVEKFMDNEYYSLHRKFEVLAERPIKDLKDFVKVTAEKFKLFQYECSAKNPEPSLNARMVLDIIHRESRLLHAQPSLWVGYNAFNAVLHGKLKKTFEAQKQLDSKIFEHLLTV